MMVKLTKRVWGHFAMFTEISKHLIEGNPGHVNMQMQSVSGITFDFKTYPLDLLSGFWSLFFASGK